MSNYTPGDRTERVVQEERAAHERYEASEAGQRAQAQFHSERVALHMKLQQAGDLMDPSIPASVEAHQRLIEAKAPDRRGMSGRH